MVSIIGKHYISYITFPLNPLNVTLDCDYVFQTMILTRLVCKFHISLFRFIKHSHSIRFIAVPCKNIVKTYDQNTIHSTNWIISSMSFGHIAYRYETLCTTKYLLLAEALAEIPRENATFLSLFLCRFFQSCCLIDRLLHSFAK